MFDRVFCLSFNLQKKRNLDANATSEYRLTSSKERKTGTAKIVQSTRNFSAGSIHPRDGPHR
ncbi:hypothetical protein ACYCMP_06520, partial [Klebsiella pneumoniae]